MHAMDGADSVWCDADYANDAASCLWDAGAQVSNRTLPSHSAMDGADVAHAPRLTRATLAQSPTFLVKQLNVVSCIL